MRESASSQCGRHAHGTKWAWTFQNNWFSATDEFFPGSIYIAYMVSYHIDCTVYSMIFKLGVKLGAQVLVGLHSLDVFTVNVLSEWMVLLFLKSITTSLNWENFHHTTWQRQAEHGHGVTLPPCRRDRCAWSSENVIRYLFSLRDLQVSVYKIKSSGERTQPTGEPVFQTKVWDIVPLTKTCCVLSVKRFKSNI